MECYLLHGSTCEARKLFSVFGDYWKANHNEFPPYQFADAVNGIDSAMHSVRQDSIEDDIEFYNSLHN